MLPRYYERLRPWLALRYSHLRGLPLGSFPSPRERRFSRSLAKPVSRSCRLYTGCRRRSTQVSRRLVPEIRSAPGFDHLWLFRYVLSGSLTLISWKPPCRGRRHAFFPLRSPPRLLTAAAGGGLKPPPVRRLRGTFPHLSQSTAQPSVERS